MYNKYDATFKRNAVAVVRSGYSVRMLATRLGISATSIENWLKDSRYNDVPPANSDLLMSLLPNGREPLQPEIRPLVKIDNAGSVPVGGENISSVVLRCGKLRIEFREGISCVQLNSLIRLLGETGVL